MHQNNIHAMIINFVQIFFYNYLNTRQKQTKTILVRWKKNPILHLIFPFSITMTYLRFSISNVKSICSKN